jgi:predicted O-methyltransferase YrrM
MTEPQPLEVLEAIEAGLANHPAFGNSNYILEQLEVCYNRRLNAIACFVPSAKSLLEALRQASSQNRRCLMGNTVVRCAIQHAHVQLESKISAGLPLADCNEVFKAAVAHLDNGKDGTALENGILPLTRLGSEPYHGWVWSEEHPDDIFGRTFRSLIRENYGELLSTPNNEEIETLLKGAELLSILLPQVSASALSHANLVGCFPEFGAWRGKQSSSQFRLGGTIFLSRRKLQNAWWVAEHLFHEALHQKLYDFRHGHSLLGPQFFVDSKVRVSSPWNSEKLKKANHWDTHRVLAAFHVYVHLSLLSLVAEQREAKLEKLYGPFRGMIESRKALERARYLGEQLKKSCWQELGLAGKRIVEWLIAVLDSLDSSPPPEGACLHLVFDLYLREADQVQSMMENTASRRDRIARQLAPVAEDEVESTLLLLSAIKGNWARQQFETDINSYSRSEWGTKFPEVRRLIAKTLKNASLKGYTLQPSTTTLGDPNDYVRRMVERGSERVYLTLEGLPQAVIAATHRAKALRFRRSCKEPVGRLLAVLATALPKGSKVLEIGTGTGVGTAWILKGLGERVDVTVISVERDRRLFEATRTWTWPIHVKFINADVENVLGTIGAVQLIFADASPFKYTDLELILRSLDWGGILLVDDLQTVKEDSQSRRNEKEALRYSILNHPKLQAVGLDWSSGIVLAIKRDAYD